MNANVVPGIVVFAFGVPYWIRSNKQLGVIGSDRARALNAPIYTQKDIKVGTDLDVTYTPEPEGEDPPPTLRIARGTVRWAVERGINTLIVVAAEPHMWRAYRDIVRAVKELDLTIDVHAHETTFPESSWYCPSSQQPRTRNKREWLKRELILKMMPFFIYKKVAS